MQNNINLAIFNILNVIRHKKFRTITEYERGRLEECLPEISPRLYKQLIEIINQTKFKNVDTFSLDNILEYLQNTEHALVEVPVSGNLSMKIEKYHSRIPRLDFYNVDDYEKLFDDVKILKSVFIEENNVTEAYYKVHHNILKLLLPENYEITGILLRILADCTDSIYIPLNLFIKNFDLLKNMRGYFRYVAIYMKKNIDKDVEKLISVLYKSFKSE